MEIRGNAAEESSRSRPAIARRSCDQCRSRKIGCDRGSPCSNCQTARIDCTHSTVTPRSAPPGQRVLISAKYERKIDEIARDIDGIKHTLQRLGLSGESIQTADAPKSPHHAPPSEATSLSSWYHSVHVIDFVSAVIERSDLTLNENEPIEVISSLRHLVGLMRAPGLNLGVSATEADIAKQQFPPVLPPSEAAVAVLRWAKSHSDYHRVEWICQILPLQKFEDVCRKVYFATEDYNEAELIIATGFLSYIFAEHAVATEKGASRKYCQLCRSALGSALLRLPFMLQASMEVIAALTLGALSSVESAKATRAWDFISRAASHCLTLGYHRPSSQQGTGADLQPTKMRLFWTVYRFEKSLSLRLGRPSCIRDAEIALWLEANVSRSTKIARIQGQIYDQLFSPATPLGPDERGYAAQQLALEVRELLNQLRTEISEATQKLKVSSEDPMKLVYLHCDLVCQSSILALILRATATQPFSEVPGDCVLAARESLSIHHQCMLLVLDRSEPFLVTEYLNWALLHTPFVPFSILFTRAIRESDIDDLSRLERFAASLKPKMGDVESMTHPYRLYDLLCQAARLYIHSKPGVSAVQSTLLPDDPSHFEALEPAQPSWTELTNDEIFGPTFDPSGWYFENQQLMDLLGERML